MLEFVSWIPELSLWDGWTALSPDRWGVYLGLFVTAFFKFAIAAIAAMSNSTLNFFEIAASVGSGALLSVVVYTYFGQQINKWVKRFYKKGKPTSFARKRRMYNFWKKYGLVGAAALAPFLSPMISVGIAVSFQESPRRIITYTSISIIVWTILFGLLREGILDILARVSL